MNVKVMEDVTVKEGNFTGGKLSIWTNNKFGDRCFNSCY